MAKNAARLRKANDERKRADAERLKVSANEGEIKEALILHLRDILGENRADKLLSGFYKVHVGFLWEETYRINFWISEKSELCPDWAENKYIKYSFFTKFSPIRGFFFSNPDFHEVFSGLEGKKI